jgi:hypothetical protein
MVSICVAGISERVDPRHPAATPPSPAFGVIWGQGTSFGSTPASVYGSRLSNTCPSPHEIANSCRLERLWCGS